MVDIDVRPLIGIKYTVHGRTPEEGFDCYGLVLYIYVMLGIKLIDVFYRKTDRETNGEVAKVLFEGLPLEKIEIPEKYCIISFDKHTHVGVYLGDGEFIHCMKNGVTVASLWQWKNRIEGYYKVNSQHL